MIGFFISLSAVFLIMVVIFTLTIGLFFLVFFSVLELKDRGIL